MNVATSVMEGAGAAAILAAAWMIDWRLGLALAGVLLIVASWVVTTRRARRR